MKTETHPALRDPVNLILNAIDPLFAMEGLEKGTCLDVEMFL